MAARRRGRHGVPTLEWITAGLGAAIVIATVLFIGYEAVTDSGGPPLLTAAVEGVQPAGGHYVVLVVVANSGQRAAAEVTIEATLHAGDGALSRSEARLDFVPGRSRRRAGLLFDTDPREGSLRVRVHGYATP